MQKIKLYAAATVLVFLLISIAPMTKSMSGTGVMVNNRPACSSATAAYSNGVMLVPAKEFIQSLGGSFSYNSSAMTGTIKLGENKLIFRLDNSIIKFNGKYVQSTAPMKIINVRFMVPAEFTAKMLGAEVYVDTGRNMLMVFQPVDGKLVYQVMPGDSLWIISQIFGTTINGIKQFNGLSGDMIYVGQKLIIRNFAPANNMISAQTIKSATLRKGAGFDFSVVNYLPAWTDISVTGENGDWYKVITPKGNGYLYYTVVGIRQNLNDTAPNSRYFNGEIPVDTSGNYITHTKYTIQIGDSMWSISEKYGIPNYELAAANNISVYSTLYPGQVLTVPVHIIPAKSKPGSESGEVLDWFKEAQYVFPINKTGKIIDIATGKSFMVERTMGANHSDTETLTAKDSQVMKEIFGGSWNWGRRPFILEVDGRRFAVSVAGMPHAGVDGAAFLQNVANRSDDWGTGPNYDKIDGNGMNGHFDVYFLNSSRHSDGTIDPTHQYNVLCAGGLQ